MSDILQELTQALASLKHTTPTGVPSTPYVNGPGGLFGVSGLERDVISTRVQPMGLAGLLPAMPSDLTDPLYPYLTGFRAGSGSNPSTACADCPTAGSMKSCIQTAPFGKICVMTREAEINRIGQVTDRGEFMDLRILNDPLVRDLGGIFPSLPEQGQVLAGRDMLARMLEVGVYLQNTLSRLLWTGTPANNLGTGYREFIGLDMLIGTNKVDALTNTDCPSLDSDVKDFKYQRVDELAPADIVLVISEMWKYLSFKDTRQGFAPVKRVLVGRADLFWELTAIWPCRYFTDRCQVIDTAGIDTVPTLDAAAMSRFRDEMRNGMFLLINGERVPYIIDDGILELSSADTNQLSAGEFASDLYFVPLTIMGGTPVTFWQYFDYAKGPMSAVNDGRLGTFYWTDGGRYLWHVKPPLNWCVQQIVKIEPRIILRTPQLAGNLQNVAYRPLQHLPDSNPADDYFIDGGVYSPRPGPSLYNDYTASRQ